VAVELERLEQMTCPIGVPGIVDKAPAMIAVAVCAELLQVRARRAAACASMQTEAEYKRPLSV